MSYVRIWVHIVFSTSNREPLLIPRENRIEVFKHMKKNASEKGLWLDCVNGYTDHAHCLVSLRSNQSIEQVVQLIKGETSHWVNENKLFDYQFNWQNEYWAVSVSESHVQRVRQYIFNQ